ncbi:uncharacterized protein PGTG_18797 [Puccinia graminis f. sp. tritici CRL 75-36-700-3]|uniref:Uncharacterized protein n=1 Tax=Puccinia graminis f. sp. tritici (strain CRL 75-36-700-3 / race SCCL) TaxID=418459 RepID=E3L8K4_PUCGT|nr:uncharacterized protein PGTG_18797 [Puccinia graminis f. sp. tritici CRL 75-36-700-3]EFP92879.2 hypothetical protein PGTG_18797 [Puccinia graminis f. sp. tritici CRL 75-36-700-3]
MAISNRRDRCSSFSCHWENVPLGWHNTPPLIHQSNNIYSNVSRRAKTGSSDVMLPSRRRDSSVSFGHLLVLLLSFSDWVLLVGLLPPSSESQNP